MVYPFGFYVNPGVTATMCNTAASDQTRIGSLCTTATVTTDCGSASTSGACTSQTITNITRLQAVALFSGQIANWNDFGGYYTTLPVTLCMRHSGAGTHAGFDLGVMQGDGNGSGWGGPLAVVENRWTDPNNGSPPYVYFNDLASDETNCLTLANNVAVSAKNASGVTDVNETPPAGVIGGAIGMIDADTASTANYKQIKYNGVWPSRAAMRNGIYDDFWIMDRLYVPGPTSNDPSVPALTLAQQTMYGMMLQVIANPANLTNASLGGTRGNYYGSANEIQFEKATGATYPYQFTGAVTPQTP